MQTPTTKPTFRPYTEIHAWFYTIAPAAPARLVIAPPFLTPRRALLWTALSCAAFAFVAQAAETAVTEAWVQRYNGPAAGDDMAEAVAVDASGNVVVTGNSDNGGGYYDYDYYTAKYAAADGALLWEQRYNGPGNGRDFVQALAVDGSGNVVVTGSSSADAAGFYDHYTAKYAAANGTLLWEKRYNGPANYDDQARAVAVDASGNVVVTGTSQGPLGDEDIYTAKYAAADGALLWEKRYNGPANRVDEPIAVAVDGNGNVVVTGSSANSVGYYDYYTAKYAATNGALLWENRYNGPGDDLAQAVAIDISGNVVVTGTSTDTSGYADFYTAKYAAANGALLWGKRYHGPAPNINATSAVAVDGSGNVVMTGTTPGPSGGYVFYTAKYAAANGAVLWEKRQPNAKASSIAVDAGGNVVATGTDDSYPSDYYYTAKYAAADGALLWEKRYNGPANGREFMFPSHSLAVGPNGMIAITGMSDGNFGSGEALNYATVVYWENLPAVAMALVSTGVRLRFDGVPGHAYNIERASDVTGPWSTIATPTAPIDGLIEYVDPNPPTSAAFYRTSTP